MVRLVFLLRREVRFGEVQGHPLDGGPFGFPGQKGTATHGNLLNDRNNLFPLVDLQLFHWHQCDPMLGWCHAKWALTNQLAAFASCASLNLVLTLSVAERST